MSNAVMREAVTMRIGPPYVYRSRSAALGAFPRRNHPAHTARRQVQRVVGQRRHEQPALYRCGNRAHHALMLFWTSSGSTEYSVRATFARSINFARSKGASSLGCAGAFGG